MAKMQLKKKMMHFRKSENELLSSILSLEMKLADVEFQGDNSQRLHFIILLISVLTSGSS